MRRRSMRLLTGNEGISARGETFRASVRAKAPREMVVRKYAKDIEEEAKRKLISEAYKKAVDEQTFDVLGYPDIEEIQFSRGQPLQFAATVETSPEFELPEYKDIPVKVERPEGQR